MNKRLMLYIGRFVYIFFGLIDLAGLILIIAYADEIPAKTAVPYLLVFIGLLTTMIMGGIYIETTLRRYTK